MKNYRDFVTLSYSHVICLQSESGCIEWWGMVVGIWDSCFRREIKSEEIIKDSVWMLF